MNAIVVVDRHWGIGKDGKLLFSLPADMKRFRALTMGGTVLMGRKTLDSLPGGKPLPGRRNIVLSTADKDLAGVEVVHTPADMRAAAASDPPEKVFVIGGGSVYATLLPFCKRVYLTKVDAQAEEPDTYFPNLDKLPGWKMESCSEPQTENGLTFRFADYVNTRL
jgi:dihydrofolate reductase